MPSNTEIGLKLRPWEGDRVDRQIRTEKYPCFYRRTLKRMLFYGFYFYSVTRSTEPAHAQVFAK